MQGGGGGGVMHLAGRGCVPGGRGQEGSLHSFMLGLEAGGGGLRSFESAYSLQL